MLVQRIEATTERRGDYFVYFNLLLLLGVVGHDYYVPFPPCDAIYRRNKLIADVDTTGSRIYA